MKIISCQYKHVNTVKTMKLLGADTSPQPKETNKQNIGVQQFLFLIISLFHEIEKSTFLIVVVVGIHFPSDHREMFSEQINTAAETALNNFIQSKENGCSL